ncbi:hypothetical protein D3C77_340060 [compost metagenome]
MNDKQPDNERQQPEGRQVEVKAVGQALQAAIITGRLHFKPVRKFGRQGPRCRCQQ